ncbi:MAG: DUF885 family protein [Gammaproteobacteria bacterium]|nr:DUF885 family protein [Gammaproteobacteria bacterium]
MESAARAFDNLVAEFYEVWFRYHPEQATQAGVRGYEGELPSLADDAVGALGNWLESAVVALEEIDYAALDRRRQLDLELLFGVCRDEYQSILVNDWRHRNPVGFLPFTALRRVESTAVSGDRDALFRALAKVPDYLSLACDQLARYPSLVPVFWLEAAVDQAKAELDYLKQLQAAFSDENEGDGRVRLATLCERAAESVDGFLVFLSKKITPRAQGSVACGRQRYQERLRFRHHLSDDIERHTALVHACYQQSLAELASLSLEHDGSQDPAHWLSRIGGRETTAEERLEQCREQLAWLYRLVRESGRFELPSEATLELRIGADQSLSYPHYSPTRSSDLVAAGLLFLASGQHAAPIERLIGDCIRYAWPGRHLQAMAAAGGEGERWVRRSHRSEAQRTGWALYVEQLLFEQGILITPEQRLFMLLEQARCALFALLEIELHIGGLALSGVRLQLAALPGYDSRHLQRDLLQLTRNPGDALASLVNWRMLNTLRHCVAQQSGEGALQEMHQTILAAGVVPVPLMIRHLFGSQLWECVETRVYNQ